MLEAIRKPITVTIIYCKTHPLSKTVPERGNQLANKAAKEATEKDILTLVSEKSVKLSKETPNYNEKEY